MSSIRLEGLHTDLSVRHDRMTDVNATCEKGLLVL